MKKTLYLLIAMFAMSPMAYAETQILLYKHHSISTDQWKSIGASDGQIIADGNWTSPESAPDDLDGPPTVPAFTAEIWDGGVLVATL